MKDIYRTIFDHSPGQEMFSKRGYGYTNSTRVVFVHRWSPSSTILVHSTQECSSRVDEGESLPMRPKARGLAQHGGPPGWRGVTRQVWFCTWWTGRTIDLPFPYRTRCLYRSCPIARWWNFQLLLYSKCTQPSVMSYAMQGRHDLVLL